MYEKDTKIEYFGLYIEHDLSTVKVPSKLSNLEGSFGVNFDLFYKSLNSSNNKSNPNPKLPYKLDT